MDEKNYYLALKTLDTLKVSLKTVPECRLTRNLQAFIQPQTDKIIVSPFGFPHPEPLPQRLPQMVQRNSLGVPHDRRSQHDSRV